MINVIEDLDERMEALISAWELTETVLIVSAMIANENFISQFTPIKMELLPLAIPFSVITAKMNLKHLLSRYLTTMPSP